MQSGLARRNRERADAAFEFGDAALQDGRRRIADTGVSVAVDLKIEQRRAVIGAVKCVGRGLVDRNCDGLCRRISFKSAVNGDRLGTHARYSTLPRRGGSGR